MAIAQLLLRQKLIRRRPNTFVLAGWGLSLFQIISTLIGSGVTLFLLNSIATDINQPLITLDIVANTINDNSSPNHPASSQSNIDNFGGKGNGNLNHTSSDKPMGFQTVVMNNGRSAATDLILRLSYPNGNITSFHTGLQSENVTIKKQSSDLLIAEIGRLSKDSLVAITSEVGCSFNFGKSSGKEGRLTSGGDLGNLTNLKCPPVNYFVTASFDQGSTFKTNIDSEFVNIDKFYSFHLRDQILAIAVTVAVMAFAAALFYRRLNRFRRRLSRPKYVFEILKEIITIRETLQKNIESKKMFTFDIWFSKDTDERSKIFNDYNDYYHLEDFYLKLKERDEIMSRKINQPSANETAKSSPNQYGINNDDGKLGQSTNVIPNGNSKTGSYRDVNEHCLISADNVIKNINWKNYQDLEDRKYYKPIAATVTIICAFLIFSVFEFYRLTFFHANLDLPSLYYSIMYIIFSTHVRAFVFFIVAREIINFQALFAYEVGTKNNVLSFFVMDKSSQIKLLLFSFIIGGMPVIGLLTDFHLISEEVSLFSTGSSLGYLFFMAKVLVDVLLFLVLVLVIPKFIMRPNVVKI
ncbi:MAG TPA: hypothetical protein VER14_06915 [Phototrophicaceae bacterium]|nr:hypothetical protein [Phototrophicaceae bacterium]